jgi:hypothetical protein
MTGQELRGLLAEWKISQPAFANALALAGYQVEPSTIRNWSVVPNGVERIVAKWIATPALRTSGRDGGTHRVR